MRALSVAAAGLVALCAAGDARAASDDLEKPIAAIIIGASVVDVGFVTYDTVLLAQKSIPSKTAGIVEGSIGAPQAVIGGLVTYITTMSSKERGDFGVALVPAAFTLPSFMAVYGIWGASNPRVDPGALYGVSFAVGGDAMLTMSALADFGGRRLSGRRLGIVEMVATAPQIAVSSYEIGSKAGSTGGWVLLDAWAGVLFVHGLLSTIFAEPQPDYSQPPAPVQPYPQPYPPPPYTPYPPPPPRYPPPPHASVDVTPMSLPGGGGVVVRGIF